ncbi:MAG: hypothetical protein K2K81_02020 [Muribaculaceae bacterium]|nr:hypothetical protein [Muribaculaceae bacterium]
MDKTGLDYAKGRIGKLFRQIFFPTLLGMMFTALITIVDGIFVGKGVGPDGIAAVNIIAPLYMVSTGIGLMLGIGASVKAVLIFPCGMGVKGAAIATAGSIAVGGVMALVYFRFSYVLKLVADMQDYCKNLSRVIAIGSSAFVTEIAMSVMMLTGNFVFMRYFGDAGVAAYSIACYLFPLMFMMSNAVAQSAQPIISYNKGIGAADRVEGAFLLSKRVALLCGTIVTVGIFTFSGNLISMFIPLASEAGEIASKGLPIYSICSIFFALNIAYIGYYQSIGKALRAMVLTLLRGAIFLVPLFFILPSVFPSWGMWAAIPASELLTYLVIVATVKKNR